MRRWVSSESYRAAVQELVAARTAAGLTQRDVATLMGKSPSFVAKVEIGERRLDFLEFVVLARALGQEPGALLGRIATQLGSQIDI